MLTSSVLLSQLQHTLIKLHLLLHVQLKYLYNNNFISTKVRSLQNVHYFYHTINLYKIICQHLIKFYNSLSLTKKKQTIKI